MTPDRIVFQPFGLTSTLDITVVEATPHRVVATMPVTPRVHQPFGYLHGGASVSLAESVASIGGFLNCPPGKAAFGLEINANHVRSMRDGTLTAVGTPLHLGRSSQIWEIRMTDAEQRLVCISRCTLAVVELDRGV